LVKAARCAGRAALGLLAAQAPASAGAAASGIIDLTTE